MKKLSFLLLTLVIFCLVVLLSASTGIAKESVKSGSFSSGSNWNPAVAPKGGDQLVISKGTILDITESWNPDKAIDMVIYGTLRFSQNGKKINLPQGSTITVKDGGRIVDVDQNKSNRISIGSSEVYNGSMGNLGGPLFTDGASPLPVTLVSFNATAATAAVQLKWTTSMEKNNDRFEVERSTNGVNFEVIGMVKGRLNSNELNTYQFTDRAPVNGVTYYRLHQVDIDGADSYSDLVRTEIKIERTISFANPVQPGFAINGAVGAKLDVVIMDMSGNVVLQLEQVAGGQALPEVEALAQGNYIIRISENGQVLNNTILAQR